MLCSKSHQAVTINPPLTELQEEDDKAQPRPVSNDTVTLQPLPLEAEDVPDPGCRSWQCNAGWTRRTQTGVGLEPSVG